MVSLPSRIKQRDELDCRLGIKSSLSDISSVIALAYVLYCANGKKSEIIYADEEIQSNGKKKLVLKESYKHWIMDNYAINENALNNNPLLTSQLEALQVGLGLMFHLAKISYVDFPTDTKERTGGERFRKVMKFSLNMKFLDLYLSAWSPDVLKAEMISWLDNSPSNTDLSNGLKQILTAFSEDTQFKIRYQGQEVIFQQIGIYNNISNENSVVAKDEQEDVGPFRIFKSFVREGLHPLLSLKNNEFLCKSREDLENYKEMVETTLNLSPKKTVLYHEILVDSEPNSAQLNGSHQIIYYGAPGTGKSYKIKEQLVGVPKENIFRTTFHPDSDYSTFVGAYKPTKGKRPLYGLNGGLTERMKNDGEELSEEVITYKFVPQAFLNAYIQAYRKPDENVFLIIEEINRGNCAQIFGDLFQLLDRNEYGVSEYTIKADVDLKTFLEEELGEGSDAIKDEELCLPSNLYIYATMNTSDQSLFPIDSAFKRRWDWEYEPIKYKNTDWVIDIQGVKYSWVSFQEEINRRIFEATRSEDKMLGDYFVKPCNGVITDKILLNKVLFYLWNDVCKDGEGDIFKTSDTDEVSYSELHGDESKQKLVAIMDYLGIQKAENNSTIDIDEEKGDDEENDGVSTIKNRTKYAINGNGEYAKKNLATELVKVYVTQNPSMSASEVVSKWKSLGKFVSHFIETQTEFDTRTDKDPRVNIIQCSDDKIYVSTNGWGEQGIMDNLINAIPKDWNLKVKKLQ